MRTTTSAPGANVGGIGGPAPAPDHAEHVATTELTRVRGDFADIADFADGLAARLLSETSRDGRGADDEYLRGYARAMQDLSDALRLDGSFPCLTA